MLSGTESVSAANTLRAEWLLRIYAKSCFIRSSNRYVRNGKCIVNKIVAPPNAKFVFTFMYSSDIHEFGDYLVCGNAPDCYFDSKF